MHDQKLKKNLNILRTKRASTWQKALPKVSKSEIKQNKSFLLNINETNMEYSKSAQNFASSKKGGIFWEEFEKNCQKP